MTAYATIIMLIREKILLAIMDRKALTTAFRADITIPDRTGLSDVTASAVRVSYPDAYITASTAPRKNILHFWSSYLSDAILV